MIGLAEEDAVEEVKKLKGELEKTLADICSSLATGSRNGQKASKDEKHFLM